MKYKRFPSDPVLTRSDFRCVYCGKDLLGDPDTLATMTRDHLVAKSAGGPDSADNRVACCAACDRLKGSAIVSTIGEAQAVIAGRRLGVEIWLSRIREAVRG